MLDVERISTEHQDEKSLDDQQVFARSWVSDRYDGEIDFTSIASRCSGEYLDREEFRRLESDIESDTFDLVIAEDLGRICRRIDAFKICELAVDHGTRLVGINDNLDTAHESWRLSAFFSVLHHRIVARSFLEPAKIKLFVVHALREATPGVLLQVAFSRWQVEGCFEDENTELGFEHFEGRSYVGLRRHQTITALTHRFLARTHEAWRGKKRELRVCQVRTAAAALVQSWWLTGRAVTRLLEPTATNINQIQQRNAAARKRHRKPTICRLHKAKVTLQRLPKCPWDDG